MALAIATADVSNCKINASSPATLQTRTETNSGSKYVATFPTGSTTRIHGSFVIPPNNLSVAPVVRLRLRAPVATSGTPTFTMKYYRFIDGNSAAAANGNSGLAATSTGTVTASAGGLFEVTFTLTTSPPANGTFYFYAFFISRNGGADSVSGDVDVLDYTIEYTLDPNITKQYLWLPAQIWLPRAGSPSAFGSGSFLLGPALDIDPYCHQLPNSSGNALGTHVQLPQTFIGGLKSYVVTTCASDNNAATFGLAMGAAAVGAAYDASLTADAFSYGAYAVTNGFGIAQRNAPISPSASDMLSLLLTRDSSDANNGIINFFGVMLEYNVFTASPCPIVGLSPECWSAPTSGAAALLGVADTNNSGYVQRFTQSVDQVCHAKRLMPSIRVSGGTFRGFLRTTASSGTIKMRIDYASPANGASADPSFTTGTVVNVPVTGANQLLQFTADISPNLLTSDEVILAMNRIGSSDGVTADVDYVEGQVEVSVGA